MEAVWYKSFIPSTILNWMMTFIWAKFKQIRMTWQSPVLAEKVCHVYWHTSARVTTMITFDQKKLWLTLHLSWMFFITIFNVQHYLWYLYLIWCIIVYNTVIVILSLKYQNQKYWNTKRHMYIDFNAHLYFLCLVCQLEKQTPEDQAFAGQNTMRTFQKSS